MVFGIPPASSCPFSVLPLEISWLVFMPLGHEPTGGGMAPVSGALQSFLQAQFEAYRQMSPRKDPRNWCGTQGTCTQGIVTLNFFFFLFWKNVQIQK